MNSNKYQGALDKKLIPYFCRLNMTYQQNNAKHKRIITSKQS